MPTTKPQPAPCRGCPHSEYRRSQGLFGAWACRNPQNPRPDGLAYLAVIARTGQLVCNITKGEAA